MKLIRVDVDGFRSIKEPLTLHIDPAVTILIGANDHGKTNLLGAIRSLNDAEDVDVDDENWNLVGQQRAKIQYHFQLDTQELEKIRSLVVTHERSMPTPAEASPAEANGATTSALEESKESEGGNKTDATPATMATDEPAKVVEIPKAVVFERLLGKDELSVSFEGLDEIEEVVNYLFARRPRLELFASTEQLMDVVTLAQLEDPNQEFMQGIFRYADIWNTRKTLFRQDPATAKRLERASEEFTGRIRDEWRQGENLTFKFQHAGQNGNQIELLIRDPAVSDRFVRPSERSEGFSAFFALNMRLLARTQSNEANKHIFLFDEPGTALHPSGQVNLQRVFERLARDNQIIYATHSLFMVSHNRPERNRVVSKDKSGTRVDQKPYLRNWRAVRDSLGLILAGNFFIADTTLLVEGESDAMYLGALLAAFDRAEFIDIDLNLFSVQWAGNARDFEPMARLMLEEGRRVVALVDGDRAGTDLRHRIEKLNDLVNSQRVLAKEPVQLVQLPKGDSVEDVLVSRPNYFRAAVDVTEELIAGAYREMAEGRALNRDTLIEALAEEKGNATLGKHVEKVTAAWFKVKEPLSKLAVARTYCSWLEGARLREEGVQECPAPLLRIIEALKLSSKLSEETVFAAGNAIPAGAAG